MDFTFTEEQDQLRDAMRGYLGRRNDFDSRTRTSRGEPGWSRDLWKALSEDLGILGAALPEEAGGSGGGRVEQMIAMEEIGASLLLEPYLETAVLAAEIFVRADRNEPLSAIASGEVTYALAWAESDNRYEALPRSTHIQTGGDGNVRLTGSKQVVTAAPWADRLIISALLDGQTVLVEVDPAAKGVSFSAYPTIDGRRAADIAFDDVSLTEADIIAGADKGAQILEATLDVGAAAIGAEAVGIMRRMLDDTVDYTRQRRQFGKAISEFQVLQHRMVDMYMELELATSAVYRAFLSLDLEAADRVQAVSSMKASVGNACRIVGQSAIQLHGGMGMTDELAVTHYFRRATAIEQEFGDVGYHLERLDRLVRAS